MVHGANGFTSSLMLTMQNSSHLLSIYSVLHISQTLSYLPYNLKSRDSAHFTDEATEDHRKEVTCLATQSWDSIWIHYSPVLPSLSPLLQVLGRLGHVAVEGNIVQEIFLGI